MTVMWAQEGQQEGGILEAYRFRGDAVREAEKWFVKPRIVGVVVRPYQEEVERHG